MKIDILLRRKYDENIDHILQKVSDASVSLFLIGRSNSGKTWLCDRLLSHLTSTLSCESVGRIVQIDNEVIKEYSAPLKEILQTAKRVRRIHETELNEGSSRTTMIHRFSNVCIVDLMGSERGNTTEGRRNNTNLLYFANALRALKVGSTVSWRNCALTRTLKECLESSQVIMIGCVGTDPTEDDRTMRFIDSLAGIEFKSTVKKRPEVPNDLSDRPQGGGGRENEIVLSRDEYDTLISRFSEAIDIRERFIEKLLGAIDEDRPTERPTEGRREQSDRPSVSEGEQSDRPSVSEEERSDRREDRRSP